jgi:ABC-type multidrug transport system ATPase subunit
VRRAVVSIENLTKSFSRGASGKAQLTVLKGVNLEVQEGEVLGLLGPNGAGKTTSIEILATLLLPTSGRASVCSHDVVRDAAQFRKVVSFCSTVAENLYPRLRATQDGVAGDTPEPDVVSGGRSLGEDHRHAQPFLRNHACGSGSGR